MKENETMEEYLQREAPLLAAIPKMNPFLVPENYFRELENTLLENSALNTGRKEKTISPFAVPENYFDQLPQVIEERIAEKKGTRIIPLFQKPMFALSLAAACIVLMLVTRPAIWFNNPTSTDAETISDNELANSTWLSTVDEHLLIEELEKGEGTLPSGQNSDSISDLENYLIDNNIDLNQLTNEL